MNKPFRAPLICALILSSIFLFSCEKKDDCQPVVEADYSLFAGEWAVQEHFVIRDNGVLFLEEAKAYDLIADEEGGGKIIYPTYEANIQLAYNPVQESISIIAVYPPNLMEDHRQLASEHYDIVFLGVDSMFWQDIDQREIVADTIRVFKRDLVLTRK